MTLKEQLRQNLTGHLSDEKTEVDVNIAEKIAEEFAIGFASWLGQNEFTMFSNGIWYSGLGTSYTIKELLEIYKQEQANKCEYCGLENGNHKLSCPVIKVTMIL